MDRISRPHPPTARDDEDGKLLADIEQFGWHILGIDQDEEGPAFAYSVGLYHTFGHPEILVIGLKLDVMFGMINGIGEFVRGGKRFEHLDESENVLDEYNVAFRRVERAQYINFVGYARWFYQGDDFPLLQCVWPDSCHRYPWHSEFPDALRWRQPVLGKDETWPFHEGKNRMCFTTRRVLGGSPILLVSHDEDGDWQFLCGTTNDPSDGALVSLRTVLARDDSLSQVADLSEGWRAERPIVGAEWIRSKNEEGDDDHE